jgi:hypothetical protein
MEQSSRISRGALLTIVAFLFIGFATKVSTTNALPPHDHVKLPKVARSSFPKHFDFGTASAAYQVKTHSKLPNFHDHLIHVHCNNYVHLSRTYLKL